MNANTLQLLSACLVMVLLVTVVGTLMLVTRIGEMRRKRIHPQAAATSTQMAARLENVQPADNFRNLFEVPVLFYALVACAIAMGHVPGWLTTGAWAFVALRVAHSAIHCSYNKVFHRLAVFMASFALLIGLWISFVLGLVAASTAP
jgi:hypothetical protein